MAEDHIEVLYLAGRWRVRVRGGETLPGGYDTRAEAAEAAREEARRRSAASVRRSGRASPVPRVPIPGLFLG